MEYHGRNVRCLLAALPLVIAGAGPAVSGSLGDINPVTSYCPERYIHFWDTIVFTLAVDSLSNSNKQPGLHSGNEYDVKFSRTPDTVGDLRQLTAERLNQLGYRAEQGPVTASHIGQLVQVQSAVTCAIPGNLRLPAGP